MLAWVALSAGCNGDTIVIVDVKNEQGLSVAHELVSATLVSAGGTPTTRQHEFPVNGTPGTFSIRFPGPTSGALTVQVETHDDQQVTTGRGTGSLELTGQSRPRLEVRLVRRLAGTAAGILGGQPGGTGNRDGETGSASDLSARLDHPRGMAILDGYAYVLERCALRRIKPGAAIGRVVVDTPVPCRAPPGGARPASGTLADLALVAPTAIAADGNRHLLFISDGTAVIRVAIPAAMRDAPPSSQAWDDFARTSGTTLLRAGGLTLGPYFEDIADGTFTTLFVADADANVVYKIPLDGGAGAVALGLPGACVQPLPPSEAVGAPAVPAAQVHLCAPGKLEVGKITNQTPNWVLFVADAGHGAVRMLDLTGNVSTLVAGQPGLTAVGYRFERMISGLPLDAGLVALAAGDRVGVYILYASQNSPPITQGALLFLPTDGRPGYVEGGDLLLLLSGSQPGPFRVDDVEQFYRPMGENMKVDSVFGLSDLAMVQSGNAVVQAVSTAFHIVPLYGSGPHQGRDRADLTAGVQPAFASPAGLVWDEVGAVFVADEGNHAVAALAYDPSRLPLSGTRVSLLAGCPGTSGYVDGPAAASQLAAPRALAYDATARALYVADTANAALRRITLDDKGAAVEVHTVLATDGSAGSACDDGGGADASTATPGLLGRPAALAFDRLQRVLYVADADGAEIVSLPVDGLPTPELQPIALPAGSGPAVGLALVGRRLYAIDAAGLLSRVDLAATPVASAAATLPLPGGAVALGTDGEWLYVAEDAARLWRVDPYADPPALEPTPLAGDGARGVKLDQMPPGLNRPSGLAYDGGHGVLLLSDAAENVVWMIQ